MHVLSNQPGMEDTLIGELYRCHWLTLFATIRRFVPSREDAEDILLDVFLAALENEALASMNAQRQEAWLRRVAHNKCVDFLRRAARRPAVPLEEHIEPLYAGDESSPEQAILHSDELAELRERLASLPSTKQEILRLRFADELTIAQIAQGMQKSESAIRMTLYHTLNHLREIYAKRRKESSGEQPRRTNSVRRD